MGWTVYHRRPADPRAELRSLVTRDGPEGSRRPLADAFVGSTWYAAVEDITPQGAQHVWAAVFLVKRGKAFGYKDMCESMGPCEDRCPKRILDLLTPLDDTYPHVGYAADWRARCRSNLAAPKPSPLQDGALVSFQAPYELPSGPCSTFTARATRAEGAMSGASTRSTAQDPTCCATGASCRWYRRRRGPFRVSARRARSPSCDRPGPRGCA